MSKQEVTEAPIFEEKKKMSMKKKLLIIFSSIAGVLVIAGVLIYIFFESFLYTFFPDIYVSYSLKNTADVLTEDIDELSDSLLTLELSNDKDYTVEYSKSTWGTKLIATVAYVGSQQKLSADFETEGILNGIDGRLVLDNYEVGFYSSPITGESYFSASAPDFGKEFNQSKSDGTAAALLYGVKVPKDADLSFSNLFGTSEKKSGSGKSKGDTESLADTVRDVVESGEVVHKGKQTVTMDGKKSEAKVIEIEYSGNEFADSYKKLAKKVVSDGAPLSHVQKLPLGDKTLSEWLDASADEVDVANKSKRKIKVKYTVCGDALVGIEIEYDKDKSLALHTSDSDDMIDSWVFTRQTGADAVSTTETKGNIIPEKGKIAYTVCLSDSKDASEITVNADLNKESFDFTENVTLKNGKAVSKKDEIKGKCKVGDEFRLEADDGNFMMSLKPGAEYKGMGEHSKYEIFKKNLLELALTFGSRLFG